MKERFLDEDQINDRGACPECGEELEWMDVENFDDYELHHFYCPKCGIQGSLDYEKRFLGMTYLIPDEEDTKLFSFVEHEGGEKK